MDTHYPSDLTDAQWACLRRHVPLATALRQRRHPLRRVFSICSAPAAAIPARRFPALFLTKFGFGIGPRGIENVVTKHCKETHIRAASLHSLRHTMAVEMLKRGATPSVVGRALGHASSDTMAAYTDLARERMDEEMQQGAL
jgi:site-specific recombinase XerD